VERLYEPVGRPTSWFLRPPNGYPGIDNAGLDEVALLKAIREKYSGNNRLPLDMGAFELIAHLLGPGPFFCARKPIPSSSFLVVDTTPGAFEPVVLQAEWLDPPPIYPPSTRGELREPRIYMPVSEDIKSAVRGMI
jgi:hypothetical protein